MSAPVPTPPAALPRCPVTRTHGSTTWACARLPHDDGAMHRQRPEGHPTLRESDLHWMVTPDRLPAVPLP